RCEGCPDLRLNRGRQPGELRMLRQRFLDWSGKREATRVDAAALPPLEHLIFVVTDKCPSWCDYCFNAPEVEGAIRLASFREARNELTTDEMTALIEAALPLGLTSVQFSGGEPLVARARDRVVHMVQHASQRKLDTTIYTNAYLASADLVARLRDAGL